MRAAKTTVVESRWRVSRQTNKTAAAVGAQFTPREWVYDATGIGEILTPVRSLRPLSENPIRPTTFHPGSNVSHRGAISPTLCQPAHPCGTAVPPCLSSGTPTTDNSPHTQQYPRFRGSTFKLFSVYARCLYASHLVGIESAAKQRRPTIYSRLCAGAHSCFLSNRRQKTCQLEPAAQLQSVLLLL